MIRREQSIRLASLIDHLLRRDYPTAVHLANEPGSLPGNEEPGRLASPRFSICLSGQASYQIIRDGRLSRITLTRGEAIVVPPGYLMEPHPDSHYLALGVVFTSEMTRFLLAKKIPGKHHGSHRFLLAHHSSTTIDEETSRFFQALSRSCGREPTHLYLRRLLQLILIKARENSTAEHDGGDARKAWFTWRSACQFIGENFGQPIGRAEVARFLQLHPNHLSRLFTRFSGGTFNQYLLGIRLDHAKRLLENPALNVNEIARACGFSDPNYFIRCFRKAAGVPPTMFRS